MNDPVAYCPRCQAEVRFETIADKKRCTACGFEYYLNVTVPPKLPGRKSLSPGAFIIFTVWMALPSVLFLLGVQSEIITKSSGSDTLIALLVFGAINSLASAYWLVYRISGSLTIRILCGMLLGCGTFGVNAAIVLFLGCATLLK